MFKQTVLKFHELGLLGFGHKDDQEDGDSGNSTPTGFSDDENDGNSNTYLTTGVLAPHGQPVSEIKVSRLSANTIRALIDGYKAKKGRMSRSTAACSTPKRS